MLEVCLEDIDIEEQGKADELSHLRLSNQGKYQRRNRTKVPCFLLDNTRLFHRRLRQFSNSVYYRLFRAFSCAYCY